MNYVDPNYEPPLFWRPADVSVPPGGSVKVVDALTRAEQKIAEHDWAGLIHSYVKVKFTESGGADTKYVFKTDWQALADFRADVIDALQVEVAELQNEIAALKMDRDAKMSPARGLGAIIKDEPPTMGETLANTLKHDSFWTGA